MEENDSKLEEITRKRSRESFEAIEIHETPKTSHLLEYFYSVFSSEKAKSAVTEEDYDEFVAELEVTEGVYIPKTSESLAKEAEISRYIVEDTIPPTNPNLQELFDDLFRKYRYSPLTLTREDFDNLTYLVDVEKMPDAFYLQGKIHCHGFIVEKDTRKGDTLITKAANMGSKHALFQFGLYFYAKEEFEKALQYFNFAAKRNHFVAKANIAAMARRGIKDRTGRIVYKSNKRFALDVYRHLMVFHPREFAELLKINENNAWRAESVEIVNFLNIEFFTTKTEKNLRAYDSLKQYL